LEQKFDAARKHELGKVHGRYLVEWTWKRLVKIHGQILHEPKKPNRFMIRPIEMFTNMQAYLVQHNFQ
jgi:hypothetical protein